MASPPTTDDLYVYLARIKRVVDGDTLVLDLDLGCEVWLLNQHCRLSKIDAPEKTGGTKEAGLLAKQHLEQLLKEHEYALVKTEYDQHCTFGRLLVELFVGEVSLNEQMIQDGYAEKRT